MNVGSLFSGIGGLDEGLRRAGWSHAFLCEQDAYRRAVLRARLPGVPVYEDVREVDASAWPARDASGRRTVGGVGHRPACDCAQCRATSLDLLCGGFPCQDLSVAGRRRGLVGDRSGLFFEYARVADALRPQWLLVENVPGLLSSDGGRDFGILLATLADIGYGLAWRILNSRYFGVPQRRRRVFIVGTLADSDPRAAAERAAQVLAVGTRCPRHSAKGGETREDVAGELGSGAADGRGWRVGADEAAAGQLIANAMTSHGSGHYVPSCETLVVAASLSHGSNPNPPAATVRRLTPRECERLQALPDDWTRLNDKTADSPRYAGLGDAVTVTVGEWIGRRIREAA